MLKYFILFLLATSVKAYIFAYGNQFGKLILWNNTIETILVDNNRDFLSIEYDPIRNLLYGGIFNKLWTANIKTKITSSYTESSTVYALLIINSIHIVLGYKDGIVFHKLDGSGSTIVTNTLFGDVRELKLLDNSTLLIGSKDLKSIIVYSLKESKILSSNYLGSEIYAIDSIDYNYIVSECWAEYICVSNLTQNYTFREVKKRTTKSPVWTIRIINRNYVLLGNDENLRLWLVRENMSCSFRRIPDTSYPVIKIDFADNETIIVADKDGNVDLWQLSNMTLIQNIKDSSTNKIVSIKLIDNYPKLNLTNYEYYIPRYSNFSNTTVINQNSTDNLTTIPNIIFNSSSIMNNFSNGFNNGSSVNPYFTQETFNNTLKTLEKTTYSNYDQINRSTTDVFKLITTTSSSLYSTDYSTTSIFTETISNSREQTTGIKYLNQNDGPTTKSSQTNINLSSIDRSSEMTTTYTQTSATTNPTITNQITTTTTPTTTIYTSITTDDPTTSISATDSNINISSPYPSTTTMITSNSINTISTSISTNPTISDYITNPTTTTRSTSTSTTTIISTTSFFTSFNTSNSITNRVTITTTTTTSIILTNPTTTRTTSTSTIPASTPKTTLSTVNNITYTIKNLNSTQPSTVLIKNESTQGNLTLITVSQEKPVLTTEGMVLRSNMTKESVVSIIFNDKNLEIVLDNIGKDGDLTGCLVNCSNRGKCKLDNNQKFICACDEFFSGSSCQINNIPCASNPCRNNGTCVNNFFNKTYTCECYTEFNESLFYGQNCEHKIDVCLNEKCNQNGACYDRNNEPKCKCFIGYSGNKCELESSDLKITKMIISTASIIAIITLSITFGLLILNDVLNLFNKDRKNVKKYKKRYI